MYLYYLNVICRELSELGLNFDREEPEMRIFSESESLVSSPRVGKENVPPPPPLPSSTYALAGRRIMRARPEEYSSQANSVNPSPKKQPRLNILLSPSAFTGETGATQNNWSNMAEYEAINRNNMIVHSNNGKHDITECKNNAMNELREHDKVQSSGENEDCVVDGNNMTITNVSCLEHNHDNESCCKRYKLEDQLSDIQYIDCGTPEHSAISNSNNNNSSTNSNTNSNSNLNNSGSNSNSSNNSSNNSNYSYTNIQVHVPSVMGYSTGSLESHLKQDGMLYHTEASGSMEALIDISNNHHHESMSHLVKSIASKRNAMGTGCGSSLKQQITPTRNSYPSSSVPQVGTKRKDYQEKAKLNSYNKERLNYSGGNIITDVDNMFICTYSEKDDHPQPYQQNHQYQHHHKHYNNHHPHKHQQNNR